MTHATLGRTFPAALLAALVTATALADLSGQIRSLIHRGDLKAARVAVSVRDSESGYAIVSINDTEPMIPASNMKVLTTGAALHLLGPEFEYRTRLVLDGDRLIVIGDGDPAFADPELLALLHFGDLEGMNVEQFVDLWVSAVKAANVGSVSELVVDDRVFDREFVHPSWPKDQLNRRYCAEVAGFSFHLNLLHFYPRAIAGQKPDLSRFEPFAPWLDVSENRATCRQTAQDANTFAISRPFTSNRMTFYGNVKSTYVDPAPVTVHDMPEFFARLLTERLRASGIPVGSHRTAAADDPVPEGVDVAPLVRTPIATVVTRCNRDSQNLFAESLLKRFGHAITSGTQPGSWSNGAAALRMVVTERLQDDEFVRDLVVADGSGLSRDNRVTAALLTAWLDSFHRDPALGRVFIDSFAIGGVSGTLDTRFRDTRFVGVTVRAKTGFIDQVSCLSGYVTSESGRSRSFSVLINNFGSATLRAAKDLQDAIVAEVVKDMMSDIAVEIGGG